MSEAEGKKSNGASKQKKPKQPAPAIAVAHSADNSLAADVPALKGRIRELEASLKEYAGWAPHQFPGLQEEHRKLQQSHIKLDSEAVLLRAQLEKCRGIINQYRKDLQHIASSRADDYCARRLKELGAETEGI